MKVIKIRTPGRLPGRLYKSRAPALKWETAADAATASASAPAGGSFIRFTLASAAAADGAGAQTGAFVHCRTCGQKVVHLAAAAKALGPFADDSFTAGGAAAAIAVAVAVTVAAAGRFVCHVAAVTA